MLKMSQPFFQAFEKFYAKFGCQSILTDWILKGPRDQRMTVPFPFSDKLDYILDSKMLEWRVQSFNILTRHFKGSLENLTPTDVAFEESHLMPLSYETILNIPGSQGDITGYVYGNDDKRQLDGAALLRLEAHCAEMMPSFNFSGAGIRKESSSGPPAHTQDVLTKMAFFWYVVENMQKPKYSYETASRIGLANWQKDSLTDGMLLLMYVVKRVQQAKASKDTVEGTPEGRGIADRHFYDNNPQHKALFESISRMREPIREIADRLIKYNVEKKEPGICAMRRRSPHRASPHNLPYAVLSHGIQDVIMSHYDNIFHDVGIVKMGDRVNDFARGKQIKGIAVDYSNFEYHFPHEAQLKIAEHIDSLVPAPFNNWQLWDMKLQWYVDLLPIRLLKKVNYG